jgi:TPR repeat protein
MFRMGVCYSQGKVALIDFAKAVEWFRKAAEEDHALALNNLGLRYVKGEGVELSFPKAIELYRRAAMQGNSSSQNNIAIRYLRGEGNSKNDLANH